MSDINDEKTEVDMVAADPESAKVEYIEYLGDPTYGTEFTVGHEVSRKHLREHHDVSTPKDLTWTKGKNGRFLVKVEDMSPEAAELLENDPAFKRVTL